MALFSDKFVAVLEVNGFPNAPRPFFLFFDSLVFGFAGWSPIYINGDSRRKGDCGMSAGVKKYIGDTRNVPVLITQ